MHSLKTIIALNERAVKRERAKHEREDNIKAICVFSNKLKAENNRLITINKRLRRELQKS
jgi:hypothetical protein